MDIEKTRPAALSNCEKRLAEVQYAPQLDADLRKQVCSNLQNSKLSVELKIHLLSSYCTKAVQLGQTMMETIATIGEKTLENLLSNVFNLELGKMTNSELQTIFTFLGIVVSNSHIQSLHNWTNSVFSSQIWFTFSKLFLKNLFLTYPKFANEYQAILKAKTTITDNSPCSFLGKVIVLLSHKMASLSFDIVDEEIKTAEKLIEFIYICLSTSTSRLATIQLLQDKQFYIKGSLFLKYIKAKYYGSSDFQKLNNLSQLFDILKRYVNFDILGESRVARRTILVHYDTFQEFQRLLFHHFGEKIEHYVIKSIGNMDTREKLAEIFSYLTEDDLKLIANKLNIFIPEDDSSDPLLSSLTEERGYKIIIEEILIFKLKSRQSILDEIKKESCFPTEGDLWKKHKKIYESTTAESLNTQSNAVNNVTNFDLTDSYAVDRIGNSFVNIEDYLIRYFYLIKQQLTFETKQSIEQVIATLDPEFDPITGIVRGFNGWTKNSIEIKDFTIYEVKKPLVGNTVPDSILAEAQYSIGDMKTECKQDWEKLKEKDVLFLISFNKPQERKKEIENELDQNKEDSKSIWEKAGVSQIRGCTLKSHMDEDRNKINLSEFRRNTEVKIRGTRRYLQFLLDPNQYNQDLAKDARNPKSSLYSIIVKRDGHHAKYNKYLNLIIKFLEQSYPVKDWILHTIVGKPWSESLVNSELPADNSLFFKNLFKTKQQYSSAFKKSSVLSPFTRLFKEVTNFSTSFCCQEYDSAQIEAISTSLLPGIHVISGPPGTGKTELCQEIVFQSLANDEAKTVVVIAKNEYAITKIIQKICDRKEVDQSLIMRLGQGEKNDSTTTDFTKVGRVNHMLKRRLELLERAQILSQSIGLELYIGLTCETAEIFYKTQIESKWQHFKDTFESSKSKKKGSSTEDITYPFIEFAKKTEYPELDKLDSKQTKTYLSSCEEHYKTIEDLFTELRSTRVMELLRDNKERAKYLMNYHCKVLLLTVNHLIESQEEFLESKFNVGTLIIDEAAQITDFEAFCSITICKNVSKVVLIGDPSQSTMASSNPVLTYASHIDTSLFSRLIRLGHSHISLTAQNTYRSEISNLLTSRFPDYTNRKDVTIEDKFIKPLEGLLEAVQFVNTIGEEVSSNLRQIAPIAGYVQNLEEAEFCVALFMFLRLQGYESYQVTIVTTEPGQRDLIQEIITKKSSWHPKFGSPLAITTIDKYQGNSNDISIVSLVRTQMTSTLSSKDKFVQLMTRGRLGLFVLGTQKLLEQIEVFSPLMGLANSKGSQLSLKLDSKKVTKVSTSAELYKVNQDLFSQKYDQAPASS